MSAHIGAVPITTDHPDHPEHGDNYITHGKGVMSWLFTLDHKRIGIMYMIFVLAAFALGGTFAILLRTLLWSPADPASPHAAASYDFYNHAFTLHGVVMVFMFMIPAIPAILGNFVLPMMLGAKDVAFPRLNLLSFWVFVAGVMFIFYLVGCGIIHSLYPSFNPPGGFGLDTGW